MNIDIRAMKIWVFCLGLAGLACGVSAAAQSVAFTFDDGPQLKTTPRMSPAERNKSMLDALAKHGVKATLFVTSSFGADRPEGLAMARAWGEAGHTIGNHTVTHPDLHLEKTTLKAYQEEIFACDRVIAPLPGYRKWFRFTFLREGNTPEKREGMRNFLKEIGYRNAYVSLDTSDWRLESKLIETLEKDAKADIAPIRQAYLDHISQRMDAYRELSQKLQGRDIAQVMLMHHNLINALWLDDAIALVKAKGWKIVSPDEAFADSVYQLQPERPAAGQSLLISMARVLGMGRFAGWERLVDDGDHEIAALKAKGL